LIDALTGRKANLGPLVVLPINTGIRHGELLNLSWEKAQSSHLAPILTESRQRNPKQQILKMRGV
jgi:hypothetical protein